MSETTITPELLARLAELHEVAMPAPWIVTDCVADDADDCGLLQVHIPSTRAWDWEPSGGKFRMFIADMEWADAKDWATANLIAEMRNALPALLAKIAAVERERDALQAVITQAVRGVNADRRDEMQRLAATHPSDPDEPNPRLIVHLEQDKKRKP